MHTPRDGVNVPEQCVIDGRLFVVGDYVMVDWMPGLPAEDRYIFGRIEVLTADKDYPIRVRGQRQCFASMLYLCRVDEVRTHRENFAPAGEMSGYLYDLPPEREDGE